ncbi:hypothetical protein B5X24_HaOG201637 [Helicoverpa armigera]|nr:hypothetical protein B5X24_HaOG201637 [Helicoverpa armigera]
MVASFVANCDHVTIVVLKYREPVTADSYTIACLPKVITEFKKNNPRRQMILHHDNASSHTARQTKMSLSSQNVQILDHPPYSSNLSTNDFITFPKIKKILLGPPFSTREEAVDVYKSAVLTTPTLEWNKYLKTGLKVCKSALNIAEYS